MKITFLCAARGILNLAHEQKSLATPDIDQEIVIISSIHDTCLLHTSLPRHFGWESLYVLNLQVACSRGSEPGFKRDRFTSSKICFFLFCSFFLFAFA
jgi:hypothetical protein